MSKYRPNIYDPIPVNIVSGKGCWVQDVEGVVYLDCLAGYSVLSHGHLHPKLVATLEEQMKKLGLLSRAFNSPILDVWEEQICKTFDGKMVIPMNSGSEAVEVAIKIARKWGHVRKGVRDSFQQIIVFDGNFHGRTTTIISFSPYSNYRVGFGPLTPGFISVTYGDSEAVHKICKNNRDVVAILAEPLQGEGGMRVPPEHFFTDIRNIANEFDVLLILDEVQTGLGRMGHVLGEQEWGIKADITVLGKALGGGLLPVSATIDRRGDIMSLLGPGDHGSTWGGNPLACAVSMKAIEVMLEEKFCYRSKMFGNYIRNSLVSMGLQVRGKGLMLGLIPDSDPREFCLALKERNVLVKDSHGTVRITPPLVIGIDEADMLIQAVVDVSRGVVQSWKQKGVMK